jgi:protein-S-isoprenylcysteine O-methyltransferase Ste14
MPAQIDIYGVFVPTLLVLMVIAYVIKAGLRQTLAWLGFYRWVWHPALFNAALYVGALGFLYFLIRQMPS